jgi:hypothetical protein
MVRHAAFFIACIVPLVSDPNTQAWVLAVRNIAVPVDVAIVGKLTQTVFQAVVATRSIMTHAFNAWIRRRYTVLSFRVQPVMLLWVPTQLASCVFFVARRNIAVPVDFAIVGKRSNGLQAVTVAGVQYAFNAWIRAG